MSAPFANSQFLVQLHLGVKAPAFAAFLSQDAWRQVLHTRLTMAHRRLHSALRFYRLRVRPCRRGAARIGLWRKVALCESCSREACHRDEQCPKAGDERHLRIGLRRLCANPFVRDRSIEILRFSEASNWAPLSGDLRGTMMLERCCAVPGKNLPDTEKWLCSYCFVWRGLASMAQPVRPAAQALQQVAPTGLRRLPDVRTAPPTSSGRSPGRFHSTDEICRLDASHSERIAH